ncbi:MAG: phage tail tube protein [Candidatus Thorarchaeota archaeon]|jgi:hypothetical protein
MAFQHGKNTVFKVDNSGGTLTDISAYCNNVDFPREVDTPEVTTFGNDDRKYIVGLRGATISVTGFWDATLDGVIGQIVGTGEVSFEYGPAGSTGGNIKYTGECILTNYTQTGPVDGAVSFSADFQITDAVVRGTY